MYSFFSLSISIHFQKYTWIFELQVGDKEIVAQEERVQEARDRLASAIKALSWDSILPLSSTLKIWYYLGHRTCLLGLVWLLSWTIFCYPDLDFSLTVVIRALLWDLTINIQFCKPHRGFLTWMKDACINSPPITPAVASHSDPVQWLSFLT